MPHNVSATVTRRFEGVQDGHVYPRWFEVGDTITGELAAAMMSCGFATDPGVEVPTSQPPADEGRPVESSADEKTSPSAITGGAAQEGDGAPSGEQNTISDGNSAGPAAAPEPPLEPKHFGRGVWWVVRGEARVKGPFDSKEDAVAALEEKGA